MSKSVNVLYKFVDGAHFFVANDEATTGLCVAHADVKKAYQAVGPQLSKLFKLNHNEESEFSPAIHVDAFVEWLESQTSQVLSKPSPGIAGTIPWGTACASPEKLLVA